MRTKVMSLLFILTLFAFASSQSLYVNTYGISPRDAAVDAEDIGVVVGDAVEEQELKPGPKHVSPAPAPAAPPKKKSLRARLNALFARRSPRPEDEEEAKLEREKAIALKLIEKETKEAEDLIWPFIGAISRKEFVEATQMLENPNLNTAIFRSKLEARNKMSKNSKNPEILFQKALDFVKAIIYSKPKPSA